MFTLLYTIDKKKGTSSIYILFGPTLYNGHLQGPGTLAPVGSGADTTSFYDLGLSRPGIGLRSPACEAQHTRLYKTTVESLEFVVAQFSWNSWVPLILVFTSSMKQ